LFFLAEQNRLENQHSHEPHSIHISAKEQNNKLTQNVVDMLFDRDFSYEKIDFGLASTSQST